VVFRTLFLQLDGSPTEAAAFFALASAFFAAFFIVLAELGSTFSFPPPPLPEGLDLGFFSVSDNGG